MSQRRAARTRLVGLTGGIASGKSAAAEMFQELGAVVIDADALAREICEPGGEAMEAILRRFGVSVLRPDGSLNREALAQIVFEDPAARTDLEQILHPRIHRLAMARISEAQANGAALIIYAAPLIYEKGLDAWLGEVIVVDLDSATQRQRLVARDGADALARIRSQMSLHGKRVRATHLLDNRGDLDALRAQVEALWRKLVGD